MTRRTTRLRGPPTCVMSHTLGDRAVIQGTTMWSSDHSPQTDPQYWIAADSTTGERMRAVVALGGRV